MMASMRGLVDDEIFKNVIHYHIEFNILFLSNLFIYFVMWVVPCQIVFRRELVAFLETWTWSLLYR